MHTVTVTATDSDNNEATVTADFLKEDIPPYSPRFGEMFYMPFDGNFIDLISNTAAAEVGTPGFAGSSYSGTDSYIAGTDNYLSFPLSELTLGNEFSGAFWYKVSGSPDRSGILTIGTPDIAENRNQGLRLFREGNGTEQRIKLNVGTGSGESWNDGGIINVAANQWVHVAFTVSQSQSKIYLNGMQVNTGNLSASIDWSGCENLVIGAGGPTFSYWNHLSDTSAMDELMLFDTALTQADISNMVAQGSQTFYMGFNDSYIDSVSNIEATVVGNPGYADDAYAGSNSFEGAADSYLSFPLSALNFDDEFSFAFWYKVNASPDRSGILTVGTPDIAENRNQGFRLFREGNATSQRIKLNVGIGSGESWNDGDVIDVAAGEWVHIAVTVSTTQTKIYFNGVPATNVGTLSAPIDWTGCENLVIGAGGPTFSYWNHLSDLSALDELRGFNKALTQEEVQALMF